MEKSCGAVVFTRNKDEIRYVLVQSLEGRFGFPKGHIEGSETEEETALREIREEVALVPVLLSGFREMTQYTLPGTQIQKQVVLFLGEYQNQTPQFQQEELLCVRLVSFEDALQLLSHEDMRQILRKAEEFLQAKGE